MLVKKIPALRPPLINGLQMLAKFRVKENPCLTSAPYQGAPNASKIFGEGYDRVKKGTELRVAKTWLDGVVECVWGRWRVGYGNYKEHRGGCSLL